jgi:hypothetical protein
MTFGKSSQILDRIVQDIITTILVLHVCPLVTAVQRSTIHGIAFSDDSCSLYILTSLAQEIPLIDSMDNARDYDGKSHRPE